MTTTAKAQRGRPEIGDKIGVRMDTDLLSRVDDYAANHNLKRPAAIRELLTKALDQEHPTTPAAAPHTPTVTERIMNAYPTLVYNEGGWVSLTRLRDHLGDIPRADMDAELAQLFHSSRIKLICEVNQKTLTDRDRQAALHIVGDNKNLYQPW